jgi:hypothetical protein
MSDHELEHDPLKSTKEVEDFVPLYFDCALKSSYAKFSHLTFRNSLTGSKGTLIEV